MSDWYPGGSDYEERNGRIEPWPKINPVDGSWICPYCGKKVYSMEVHPCNQPYC